MTCLTGQLTVKAGNRANVRQALGHTIMSYNSLFSCRKSRCFWV